MKCPICCGELVPKDSKIDAGVAGVAYQYFECKKCHEEMVFEDEAKKAFAEIIKAKKENQYKKRIGYAGNSFIVRIPNKIAKSLHIKAGTPVEIIAKKEGFAVNIE